MNRLTTMDLTEIERNKPASPKQLKKLAILTGDWSYLNAEMKEFEAGIAIRRLEGDTCKAERGTRRAR